MSVLMELAGPLTSGLAVALLVRGVFAWVWAPPPPANASHFESWRAETLRAADPIYRRFESLIVRLARRTGERDRERLEAIGGFLKASAEPLPWTPALYLGRARVLGGLVGLGAFAFVMLLALLAASEAGPDAILGGGVFATALAAGLIVLYPRMQVNELAGRSRRRLRELKARLAFAIDLLALMMEAGANFPEALESVVRETAGTPLGEDFAEVLRQIRLGKPRADALSDLQRRLNDEDVGELIFAINKGEELGTPLSQILKTQSHQVRLKRSQWIEKAVGEAQVKILLPGMIVMIASLLVIVSPFVLKAISSLR